MYASCEAERLGTVKMLLAAGANTELRNNFNDNTAFLVACGT